MADSHQAAELRRLELAERQRREAAARNSNSRITTLPSPPPRNIARSLEQPSFTNYGLARTASSQSGYQPSRGYGAGGVSYGSSYQPSGGDYGAGGSAYGSGYRPSGGGHGAGGSSYGPSHQPSGGDYGAGGSSYESGYQPYPPSQPSGYPNLRPDPFTALTALQQSMPPTEGTIPAVFPTLAPQSDPHPSARSSTGGQSRARGLAIKDIIDKSPEQAAKDTSFRTKPSNSRRKASPRRFIPAPPKEDSEEDVPQSRPRSKRTELVVSQGGEVWTAPEVQTLKNEMGSGRKQGDSHPFQRAYIKLGLVHSPSECKKKWEELEAAEKLKETAARPAGYYRGEAALEQYDSLLVRDWNRTDAIKLHVLKDLNPKAQGDKALARLGHKYSADFFRQQWGIMKKSGFQTLKPASRPWTDDDIALFIWEMESNPSEEQLMYVCIRTREDIQRHWNEMRENDNALSTERRDKRKAEDEKEADEKSKKPRLE